MCLKLREVRYQIVGDELCISSREAEEQIERLLGLDEHHDIGFELKQSMNIGSSEESIKILAKSLRKLEHDPLKPIRDAVEQVLSGQKVPTDRLFLTV